MAMFCAAAAEMQAAVNAVSPEMAWLDRLEGL
jgi:hypothetical protein